MQKVPTCSSARGSALLGFLPAVSNHFEPTHSPLLPDLVAATSTTAPSTQQPSPPSLVLRHGTGRIRRGRVTRPALPH